MSVAITDRDDTLTPLIFHEWWELYNERYKHPTGGAEWLAAYAAWHYATRLAEERAKS